MSQYVQNEVKFMKGALSAFSKFYEACVLYTWLKYIQEVLSN